MGLVYLAEHELIEKRVALKILRPECAAKPDVVSRFRQEAISASRIKHANVLDVFDFGQIEGGSFFLAMELLRGHDLGEELASLGVIDPRRGTFIGVQMCRALAAAHSRGVIHRDMKPENVFLHRTDDGDETVKIVDFGIAQLRAPETPADAGPRQRRLTRPGMIFGTPEYMSPEQALGAAADLRTDVYAVGIILYEMFSGSVPFKADSFMGLLKAHAGQALPEMAEVYPDVEASPQLQAVVSMALAKSPDQRFQSMGELAQALLGTPEGLSLGLPQRAPIPIVDAAQFVPSRTPLITDTASHFLAADARDPHDFELFQRDSQTTVIDGTPPSKRSVATADGVVRDSRWRRRSLGGAAVAVIASAMVAGAFFLTARPMTPAQGEATRAAVTPSSLHHEPKPAGSTPAPVVHHAPQALPARVELHVRTEPPGAVLFKDGFQICDATPCRLLVDHDRTLSLEARRGTLRGSRKVLAQHSQTVDIPLVGPPKETPPRTAPSAPPPSPESSKVAHAAPPRSSGESLRLCEVEADGLKILRPCPE